MTREETLELNRELKEIRRLVSEMSTLSLQVHQAADRAIESIKGDENGG